MEKMGCGLEPGFFSSVDCEGKINGGFHLDDEGKPGVGGCIDAGVGDCRGSY